MDFFRFGLFLNSSATDIVLVTLPSTAVGTADFAQCTSRCAMARGHRRNTSIVLAAVHSLSGRFPRSHLSLSRPLPTLSPSLIGHLASVDIKQHERNPPRHVSRFGLAVRRLVSGRTSVRYRFGSPFSSKRLWFVDTCLVTLSCDLSCDFVHHCLLKH